MVRIVNFKYIVSGGDFTTDLDYKSTSAIQLNGGSIYTTSSSEDAILTLPSPSATDSLSFSSEITVGTYQISAADFNLQPIQTSGSGIISHVATGSLILPSISTSGVGCKKNVGSGEITLPPIQVDGSGTNAKEYPTITLSPRNIEALTSYNREDVVVTAIVTFAYPITSADGISTNLLSTFSNYNQLSANAYSVDINVGQTGTLVATVTGHDSVFDIYRSSTDSVVVSVNKYSTPIRYETSAYSQINLKSLLPVHLEYSETGDFLGFFEDFLNEMYYEFVSHRGNNDLFTVDSEGNKSYYRISADNDGEAITSSDTISVSGSDRNTSEYNVTYDVNKTTMISILEKAKRLTDLHDPGLIDIEYIQDLASYMGYNINVHRDTVDGIGNTSDTYSTNMYLRNIVSSLPQWYRIKSTDNAIKSLLYSFGVVGEIIQKWTKGELANANAHPSTGGYGNDLSKWSNIQDTSAVGNLSAIPDDYFPTPHFDILVDLNSTPSTWFENIDKITKAIDSIRPVQAVFEKLVILFQTETNTIYVRTDQYTEQKMIFDLNEEYPSLFETITETGNAATQFTETGSGTTIYIENV